MIRTSLLALSTLTLLVSCSTVSDEEYARPWLNSPQMDEWRVLNRAKAEVAADGMVPQMQEFVDAGTMFVWRHSLDGGPGWEHLRASYTYRNTTDKKFDWIRVWCEVLDRDGRIVNRGEEILMHPLGYAMDPGDTHSDTIKVPTKGAHMREGWSWRIGCEPVKMKVLPAVGPRRVR